MEVRPPLYPRPEGLRNRLPSRQRVAVASCKVLAHPAALDHLSPVGRRHAPVHPHPPRAMHLDASLDLRRWALRALGPGRAVPSAGEGEEGTSDPLPAPPTAAPGAWRTFLRAERCAGPLLGAPRLSALLPPHAHRIARGLAHRELQDALALRGQLADLAQAARSEGVEQVIILKGGVPIARGRAPLAVVDLDVLVEAADAPRLARRLDRIGYLVPAGGQEAGAGHHLRARVRPGLVPIEIHTRFKIALPGLEERLRAAARPLEGLEPLAVPHPAAQLEALLGHGVNHHADRRGSLRELLLLVDALSAMDPGERPRTLYWLRRRLGPADAPLQAQLDAALDLLEGRPVPDDPFPETAAVTHLLTELLDRRILPRGMVLPLAEVALHRLGAAPGRGPWGRASVAASRTPGWLRHHLPLVDRGVRHLVRFGGLAALEVPARLLEEPLRRAASPR